MPHRRVHWYAPILVLAALSGCTSGFGNDAGVPPGAETAAPSPDVDALWAGRAEITILEIHAEIIYQYDVLCQFGGGPLQARESPERVLPGTDHLLAFVEVAPTFTGMQLGYAKTRDPQADERLQDNITWLTVVRDGSAEFTIPVAEGEHELPGEPPLWAFYIRMQPLEASADCYTGGGTGKWDVVVTAVRGAAAQMEGSQEA